jgi:hypothetical protein
MTSDFGYLKSKIMKTVIKNALFTSAIAGISLLASCKKEGLEIIPTEIRHVTIESQAAAPAGLAQGTAYAKDPKVKHVVIDMQGVDTLTLGAADRANIRVPAKFYEQTRGSGTIQNGQKIKSADEPGNIPSIIDLGDEGNWHFEGALSSIEYLQILDLVSAYIDGQKNPLLRNSDEPHPFDRVTTDKIIMSSGMRQFGDPSNGKGLIDWEILRIGTDTISSLTEEHGWQLGGIRGCGKIFMQQLPSGRTKPTRLNNTEYMSFDNIGEKEMLEMSTPARRRDGARIITDDDILLERRVWVDTVRFGGPNDWRAIPLASIPRAGGGPLHAVSTDFVQIGNQIPEKKCVIYISAESGRDTIIDGKEYGFIEISDLAEWTITIRPEFGFYNTAKPIYTYVPAELPPHYNSWREYLFKSSSWHDDVSINNTIKIITDPNMSAKAPLQKLERIQKAAQQNTKQNKQNAVQTRTRTK